MVEFEFSGVLCRHEGGSWSEHLSEQVERFSAGNRGGWGSGKVDVTIGSSQWSTSPLASDGRSFVPVKDDLIAMRSPG